MTNSLKIIWFNVKSTAYVLGHCYHLGTFLIDNKDTEQWYHFEPVIICLVWQIDALLELNIVKLSKETTLESWPLCQVSL